MLWTKKNIILIILLVASGTTYTLLLKYSNTESAKNSIGIDEVFNHPFLQVSGYFFGEFMCLIAYFIYVFVKIQYAKQIIGKKSVKVIEQRKVIVEEVIVHEKTLIADPNDTEEISYTELTPKANENPDAEPIPKESPIKEEMKSKDLESKEIDKLKAEEELKRSSDLKFTKNGLKVEETQTVEFTWRKSWVFIFPAICDICASSVSFVGLALTSASSYQMIRGSQIIFTGVLSRMFLRKYLFWYKWIGMLIILTGLFCVGSSDLNIQRCKDQNVANSTKCDENVERIHSILGDSMILCASLVWAIQLVIEEKIVKKYAIAPIQAVGWEGCYGFFLYATLLVAMAHIGTSSKEWGHSPLPPFYLEDAIDGLTQLGNNSDLLLLFCVIIILSSIYVCIALTLTQELSATTRTVTDSLRTLNIWIISLGLGWQQFHFLQVKPYF